MAVRQPIYTTITEEVILGVFQAKLKVVKTKQKHELRTKRRNQLMGRAMGQETRSLDRSPEKMADLEKTHFNPSREALLSGSLPRPEEGSKWIIVHGSR